VEVKRFYGAGKAIVITALLPAIMAVGYLLLIFILEIAWDINKRKFNII